MSSNLKIKIEVDYITLFQGEAENETQMSLIARTLADCYVTFPKFKEDSASKELNRAQEDKAYWYKEYTLKNDTVKNLQKEVDDLKSKLQKFLDASK